MGIFSEKEQNDIRKAVEAAEHFTSGEIRVCVEKKCSEPVLDRAANYFKKLEMDQTTLRNGVLIYIATHDRKFAIIGDSGINKVVPPDFWDSTKETMLTHFQKGQIVSGIIAAVHLAGKQLQTYFPHQEDTKNELPDDISFMDGH
ncbi:MAG TPA: TPM domain-containing protein [Daejeonella sp.]|nr:TPM domain-containing protein [Daejeonella sp.]